MKIEFQELTTLQEDEFEKKLVWVFTMGRSGSGWLAKQLLSFNTYYMNEPSLTDHLGVSRGNRKAKTRIIDARKDSNNYFFAKKFKHIWSYYLRKLILNRIHVKIKDTTRKIIIKEASNIDASDIISEILPNCKVILLYRDGRDVVDSQVSARLPGSWGSIKSGRAITEDNRLNFIKNISWDWVFVTENLLKTADSGLKNIYTVKYEDLKKNTFEKLKELYDFIEVNISDNELVQLIEKYKFENIPDEEKGEQKFFRSASPGKWREHFSEDEQKFMNEIMGTTLQKLGYV